MKTFKKTCIYVVLVLVTVFTLFPLATLIITSFKTNSQVVNDPYGLIPAPFSSEAFGLVFKEFPLFKYLGNSLIICVTGIIGVPLTSSMAGYAFARFNVRHKGFIFVIMLATMMIPGTVLQIPTFEMYKTFKWINTFYPFIIPSFLGGGIANVFLIRQFMMGVSNTLFEAAEIDGAGQIKQFTTIAIPLSLPIIITIAIFTFTGSWNDFFSPLLYLTNEKYYTLGYGLFIYLSSCKIGSMKAWNQICAASILMMLPVFIIFVCGQKYFVEGIQVGGVKG